MKWAQQSQESLSNNLSQTRQQLCLYIIWAFTAEETLILYSTHFGTQYPP